MSNSSTEYDECPYCGSKDLYFKEGEWFCRGCKAIFSSDEFWEGDI